MKKKTIGAIITAGCAAIAGFTAFVRDFSEIDVENLKHIVSAVSESETVAAGEDVVIGPAEEKVSETLRETIRQVENMINETTAMAEDEAEDLREEENSGALKTETEASAEDQQLPEIKQTDGYKVSTKFKCEFVPEDIAIASDGTVYMVDETYLWDSKTQEKVTVMSATGNEERHGSNLYYNPYEDDIYMGATGSGSDLNIYRLSNGSFECVFRSNQTEALRAMTVNSSSQGICGMFSDGTMLYMTDSGRVFLLDLDNEGVLGWFDLDDKVPMVLRDTLYLVSAEGFEEADFTGKPIRSIPFSFGGDINGWLKKRVCSDGTNAYFTQDDKIYSFDGTQVTEYLDLKQTRYYTRMFSNFLTVHDDEILYYDYMNHNYKSISK